MLVAIGKCKADERPVCGYCGFPIEPGPAYLDPRGAGEDGQQRAVHMDCEKPFRAVIEKGRAEAAKQEAATVRQNLAALLAAAVRVRAAYLDYGPVDDGRPEGDEFAAALDDLSAAAIQAGAKVARRKKRRA